MVAIFMLLLSGASFGSSLLWARAGHDYYPALYGLLAVPFAGGAMIAAYTGY